jgi:hypothetical protein
MQKLQTLDDAGVEFDEGSLVQAVDIDLPHARRLTLPFVPKATMPIAAPARNVAHEFARCQALPPNLPRLPMEGGLALNFTRSYPVEITYEYLSNGSYLALCFGHQSHALAHRGPL